MTTPSSEILRASVADGVEVAYQTFGDQSAEPLLLVMGLGGPMTWWDSEFCAQLAGAGFFVIRFDNRDAGRSSRGTGRVTLPVLARAFSGMPVRPPYTLRDLARDAFGLLDHLGVEAAHLVGMSMGGMIAQTMALSHPERTLSLTSIMSTTGRRAVGWQHPRILPALLSPSSGEEAYLRSSQRIWSLIQSPGFPASEAESEQRARDTWEYGVSQSGTGRQMLAVLTQEDRTRALRGLSVPTLVIHGLADRMVHVSGGRATAAAVPGSELILIKGMGHDLPRPLWRTYLSAIRRNADRARTVDRTGLID